MPGQFKHLAPSLARRGDKVVFVTQREGIALPGVRRVGYAAPKPAQEPTHPYVRLYETSVRYGQQVYRAVRNLLREGFRPDIVVAHPGWGESLFLRDLLPTTPILNFCEFYYHGRGADVGFDPEEKVGIDDVLRARARNAHLLLSLESADAGLSPTVWQKTRHPAAFQDRISVIFDGVDTGFIGPDATARFTLPGGRVLTRDDEIVTYIARNLEPYRGFPSFVRALPALLEQRPAAQVLVVGGDDVSYGRKAPGGKSWRETMLAEVEFDRSRVHFLGKLPYRDYRAVLQISSLHIYLTRPFVLSWSCIEALSAGCLVLGSATPPVEEVITEGENGFLVDMHKPAAIASRAAELLAERRSLESVRQRARELVLERYALSKCLPAQIDLVDTLVNT